MSDWRARALFALSILAALLLAGCGPSTQEQIDQTKSRAKFPMLWLGESYRGYEVNDISSSGARGGMYYGSCDPPNDGGCPSPYDLQEIDACSGFPGGPRLRTGYQPGPGESVTYREGGGLVILTGRTYLKLFGERPMEAFRALRPLGQTEPTTDPLPAPAPGVLKDHRCKVGVG